MSRGHGVFVAQCAGCHTLTGHDTSVSGGDLALGRMSVRNLVSFARVMPLRQPLTERDALAVARYIEVRAKRR